MRKNIGRTDRFARLVLAIGFGLTALFAETIPVKTVAVLASILSLYEALAGWCAFYALIGKNTCPTETQTHHNNDA